MTENANAAALDAYNTALNSADFAVMKEQKEIAAQQNSTAQNHVNLAQ